MKVHILGSGTPTPTPARFGSAYVIEVANELIMFDCGPATTHKLVKAGLWPTDVEHIFFTHHHFDHDADLPCFLLCRWDQSIGVEKPLRVFGPAPTSALTEGIIGAKGLFAHDWLARMNHRASQQVFVNRGGTLPRLAPMVLAQDVEPGFTYTSERWGATAAYAQHAQPYLDSLAWRLDTEACSVVITGDTEPCNTVDELARGADVIICMCWDRQSVMEAHGEAQGQCGTVAAAQLAQRAGARHLVLVHSGPSLSQPSEIDAALADVAAVFSGQAYFAAEVVTYEF